MVQCTVYILKCTVYILQFTVYMLPCTVQMLCTALKLQCTVYTSQCTMFMLQCTVYTLQCTVYSVWALRVPASRYIRLHLGTLHYSTLLYSTLLHSTILYSTLLYSTLQYFLYFSTFFTYSEGAKNWKDFLHLKTNIELNLNYIRNHMYIGKAEIPRATSCDFESCTRECIQLI